jgi:PAS domain S-box-containing protein
MSARQLGRSPLTRLGIAVWSAIPQGSQLPDGVWHQRHHGILALLWIQAFGIVCFSLYTAHPLSHSLLEGGTIALAALVATLPLRPRVLRATAAAAGLIACSAILVHLSGGTVEFHFHLFVMVGLLALYQEWIPFLLAITFVVLHHRVVGVLDPSGVYNHAAAIAHPWRWALIHAVFITAMSIVSLITWRVNETSHAFARLLLSSAGEAIIGLDLDHRVTFVNEAAVKLFGWDRRRMIGERFQALPLASGEHEDGVGTARARLETFRKPDGTEAAVEYVRTEIVARGTMVGTVLVLTDVTERQRSFQESERRRRTAEGLGQVGRLISQSLDVGEVAERITESVRTLLGVTNSALFEAQADQLVSLSLNGDHGPTGGKAIVYPVEFGAAGGAAKTRQPIVRSDLLTDSRIPQPPDQRARMERAPFRAVMALPLLLRERMVGVLVLGDRVGRVFSDDEVRLAQAFADQAAIAIENARLHRETRERLLQSETLLTVSQQVSGTLDVTEMMRRVAKEAGKALAADMAGAFLANEDRTHLRPIAGYHVPNHLVDDFITVPIPLKGHRVLEDAWQRQRAVAITDVAGDPRVDQDFLRRFPHRSNLFCPMVVQGEPIGGLFVTWLEEEHHFTPAELRLVEGISRQAAVALSHARLVDELKSHQSRLEALLTIAQELSRIQPVEPLLSRVAEACGRLFDAESAAFRLVQGQDLVTCGTWGYQAEVIPAPPLKIGEGLTGVVATTGEALVVDHPDSDRRLSPVFHERYRGRGIRAFLGVPVKVDEQVVGVLTVWISREGGFTAGDVEIAKAFASQAAVALENSRRYQETQGAFDELSRTKDQLVQAQKMEAVAQLAGGVAHDFNNLLTVITGRSRLFLTRTPAGSPGRRDVELIDQAADRAAALTRQLLAFSRKQVLQPRALDPNALIGGLAPMLTRLIGEHIELVIVPGRDVGQIMADPGQLEQVIMNLVVNARDAMPDGGMVKIDTERRDLATGTTHAKGQIAPGRYVLLGVQDSGSGMDDATLGKIFEPFFTTKEPGKGTGLGLATVYGIVHQSGGTIGVDSAPGRGTTFTIYLPRIDAPVAAREAPAGQAGLERGDETILLVEDDHEVRQLAAEVLKAAGYTVLESGDPLEALVIGDRHRDDIRLLISDMVMPAMRGPALAAQILQIQPEARVLYMSGYTTEAIASQGAIDPPGPLLQKPFTPDGLARIVRQVLDSTLATR